MITREQHSRLSWMNGRSENWQIATGRREECVCLCNAAGREDLTRAQRRGRPTGSSYGRQCGYRSRRDRSPSFLSAPRTSLLPIQSTGSRLTTHCSPLLDWANKTSTNEFGAAPNFPSHHGVSRLSYTRRFAFS